MIDITKRVNTPEVYEDILYIKDLMQLAIPKKVVYNDFLSDNFPSHCPNCHQGLYKVLEDDSNFCFRCGQRIYWE